MMNDDSFIEDLLDKLFKKPSEESQKSFDEFFILFGSSSCLFQGEVFLSSHHVSNSGRQVQRPIHPEVPPHLLNDFFDLVSKKKQLTDDITKVRRCIYLCFMYSENKNTLRDNLPESLVQLCPNLKNIPRTRDVASYLEEENKIAYHYIRSNESLIDTYAALNLLL